MRKLLAVLLAIMLLISGSIVFAEGIDLSKMTAEELSALIESLSVELEARKAATDVESVEQAEAITGAAALAAINVEEASAKYSHLEKGAKGDAVKNLQTRLKELGFYSISIDGDYGNGTVNAIKAFEEYNGLELTGIATVELQAFIFSDDAQGIEIPDLEITSLGMRKSYGYYFLRPTIVNHTDKTIGAFTYMLKAYNTAGERIHYSGPMSLDDIYTYSNSQCYIIENATGEIGKLSIKPGTKYSLGYSNEIDLYNFEQGQLDSVYMAIIRYVTSDGDIVEIPENEQIWYGNNGKIVTVEYENNLKPVAELTFEIEQRADSYELGINNYYIDNFVAEVIDLPVGGVYVNYVNDGSILDMAGIKEGDIIVKIGDVWTYSDETITLAKGLVDEQEPTKVVFYRRGQRAETEFTLY